MDRPETILDTFNLGHDLESVCGMIAKCSSPQVYGSEPDDKGRNDWIVKIKMLHEDGFPLYVKVALHLTDMLWGQILSFKDWDD